MNSSIAPEDFLVVDDHGLMLEGTIGALRGAYPKAVIRTAITAQEAQAQLSDYLPSLLILDLSIPACAEATTQVETGIQLLRDLTENYPNLNIAVQSAHTRALVRLQPSIQSHQAGFVVINKSLPFAKVLKEIDYALEGRISIPPNMRTVLEIKPEWLEAIQFAFVDGLTDKAIAQRMHISERTVRHYFTHVQAALNVYSDSGQEYTHAN